MPEEPAAIDRPPKKAPEVPSAKEAANTVSPEAEEAARQLREGQDLKDFAEGGGKAEHSTRGKIKDIKQQVQHVKEEIKKLHDIRTKEAESPVNILGLHETKEAVLAEVDEFLTNPPEDPEQYMLTSQRLIKRLNRQDSLAKEAREKDKATQRAKKDEYGRLKEQKDQILEDAGGVIGPIRGRRLRALEKKLFELEPDMPDPGELSWESQHYLEDSSISLRVQDLKRGQTEVVKKYTQEQVSAIATKYDGVLSEIQASGEISGEIMQVFFDELVIPEIDALGTIGEMSEPCVELFKRWVPQLRDAYGGGKMGSVRSGMVRDIDEQHGGDKAGVFLLDESIYEGVLHREKDKSVVQSFVTKLAVDDIDGVLQEAQEYFGEGYRGRYSDVDLARELKMDLNESRREESGATSDTIRIGKEVYFDDVLTSIFASSESAREIFGSDIMTAFAASRREKLLEHLGETSPINTLRAATLDPTPEVVQKLILLSIQGGENSQFAQATLASVAQREEWPQLLGEVVAANPQMAAISEVFAESEVASQDFGRRSYDALSEYMVEASTLGYKRGATPLEQSITLIIRPRLSAQQSIELGQKLGVFNQEEVSTLSEAVTIVARHTQDADGATHDGVFDGLVKDLITNNIVTRREEFDRLLQVSRQIISAKEDPAVVQSLASNELKELVFGKKALDTSSFSKILELINTHPAIISQEAVKAIAAHKDVFANPQGLTDLVAVIEAYAGFDVSVVDLVGKKGVSVDRALELAKKHPDILSVDIFRSASRNPGVYLHTDHQVEFYRQICQSSDNPKIAEKYSQVVANSIRLGELTEEVALLIPKHAPRLLEGKNGKSLQIILKSSDVIAQTSEDIEFLDLLVGRFSRQADPIIKGYAEALTQGVMTPQERHLVLELTDHIKIVGPQIIVGYKRAKESGTVDAFFIELKGIADCMGGSHSLTDEQMQKPYFKELLMHVFPNNSGENWVTYDSTDSCEDRSGDISKYQIKDRYEIDLMSGSEVRLKDGQKLDLESIRSTQQSVLELQSLSESVGHDPSEFRQKIAEEIESAFANLTSENPSFPADISTSQKLTLLVADGLYGLGGQNIEELKKLLIGYELGKSADLHGDFIDYAGNIGESTLGEDYRRLCQLDGLFKDKIKESARELVQEGWNNPQVASLMEKYFSEESSRSQSEESQKLKDRMQIGKLALSDSFVARMQKLFKQRSGREYTSEQVARLINLYEGYTGGLQARESSSKKSKEFYGRLKAQREKTLRAIKDLGGGELDPKNFHLGEVNLDELIEAQLTIQTGQYDADQFAAYTTQRILSLFDADTSVLEREIAKLESTSGQTREVLYGYITKSKISANARMTGGVCVSGDNPDKNAEQNMWDMPNYLQMVFQDPEALRVQGLILMHEYKGNNGERILSASLNPSSTYLFSVDEASFFSQIMVNLEGFAEANGFDMIVASQNNTIRTNRTGGEFEQALQERVQQVGKSYKFDEAQQFSYKPNYQIQETDVLWERSVA